MEYFLSIFAVIETIVLGFILYFKIKKRNKILISIQRKSKTLIDLRESVQERINLIIEQRDTISDLREKKALLNNELRAKMEYLENLKK